MISQLLTILKVGSRIYTHDRKFTVEAFEVQFSNDSELHIDAIVSAEGVDGLQVIKFDTSGMIITIDTENHGWNFRIGNY